MSQQVNNPNATEAFYLLHETTLGNKKNPLLAFLQILSDVGLSIELPAHELEEILKASDKHALNMKNPNSKQSYPPLEGDSAMVIAAELQAILQIKSIKKVYTEAKQEEQVNKDILKALKRIKNGFGVLEMLATMKAQSKSEKQDTKHQILRLEAITNAMIEHDKEHKHPSKNGHDSHGTSGHK